MGKLNGKWRPAEVLKQKVARVVDGGMERRPHATRLPRDTNASPATVWHLPHSTVWRTLLWIISATILLQATGE